MHAASYRKAKLTAGCYFMKVNCTLSLTSLIALHSLSMANYEIQLMMESLAVTALSLQTFAK